MTGRQTSPADGEQRLFEQLAVLLETRDRTGSIDTATVPMHEPDIAAGVEDYFAAADVVTKFAAGLVSPSPTRPVLPMPERIGDYELLAEIGRGGAAVVYKARQIGLNRLVAIKMLQGGRPGSLHDVARLRFEAEAVAHLEHPGIVPIHDVGEHHGRPFFSMALYEEGSLAGRLQDFVAQPRRAAELVATIAEAVQHAHERGILHRDLKPSNILLDAGGRPHVADFGLAKRLAGDQELTRPGELIGTPAYMAPERVAGSAWAGPATIATDVYGLGAILYVLLAGRPPFEGETPIETLLAVGTTDIIAPSDINAHVDHDLQAICLHCLEKVPSHRYATAADVAADLRRWLAGEAITARHPGLAERCRRWCRRHPVRATAVVASCLLLTMGTIGLTAGYFVVNEAYEQADSHRQIAETRAQQLNRQLYVSQMSLAHRHVQRGELLELRTVLDQYRNQPELQGFEWCLFDHQAKLMPREVARFTQHTHFVYGGALSPDGLRAATCGADGTIRMWDAATGVEQRVWPNGAGLSPAGVPYDENCVMFSPDGAWLATAGEDGGVRLWSVADGTRVAMTPTHPAEATCRFSPDGRWLAGAWANGHVHVWDMATHGLKSQFLVECDRLCALCFTRSGDEIITGDLDGIVTVWDSQTGELRREFPSHDSPRALSVSPDGERVAVAGTDDIVRIHRLADGFLIATCPGDGGYRALEHSPDGAHLAVTGNDGCVWIWSATDHRLISKFKAHPTTVWRLEYSRDGSRLLTVGSDQVARIWDVSLAGEPTEEAYCHGPLIHVACSPDGRHLVSMTPQGDVHVHNTANLISGITLPEPAARGSWPTFLRDGRIMACVNQNLTIRFWDLESGELLPADLFDPESYRGDAVSRAPALLTVVSNDRLLAKGILGSCFAYEDATWSVWPGLDDRTPRSLLGALADGRTLLVRCENPSRIEFYEVVGRRLVRRSELHCRANVIATSNDGCWLASADANGIIELFDLAAPHTRRTLVGHYRDVTSLSFSNNGRTLVSTSRDGTARLWNVATGSELCVLVEGERHLHSAGFFPDGRTLAICGEPDENGASLWIFRTE
ncbi:MAG: protein kinase [Planctomycetaceae bacterium]|nr:protein kinase [Planctomycetaceae bacterium]